MKTFLAAGVIGAVLLASAGVEAATVTLYDGSGTPASQPWLTFTNAGGTETVGSGVVNLNTSANNAIYAGYSNFTVNPLGPSVGSLKNSAFPTLDPTVGYTLNFAVRINSQVNDGTNGPNRAGFSVIALSNNNQGIELGFRTADVFAQNVGFTQGESVANPLSSTLTNYSLAIQGSSYTLSWGGSNSLTGSLRNYSTAGAPYTTPNFIFLGDDTTSARANIDLGPVSLTTGSAAAAGVPFGFSPTLGLAILGIGGSLYQWVQRRASKA